MISPDIAGELLPPTFQILTGLSFAALLAIRFLAAAALRPLWGKVLAFSVLFIALGNFLLSLGTAKASFDGSAEMLTLGGASFLVAALLVALGLILAARGATLGVVPR